MMKKFWNSYWPGLLWTIAIFILLILPGSSFPTDNWLSEIYIDKWIHLFLFAGFVMLWSMAVKNPSSSQQKKILLKIMLCGILFGVLMEVIQHFWVTSRSFEIKDILADATGCAIGWLYRSRKLTSR